MSFIQDDFPPTTGLKYLGALHKTMTYALQVRDHSPFQPDPIDSAAQDNLALARATQDILAQSIRKCWRCMTRIIDRTRSPNPMDLAPFVDFCAPNPEMMFGNGLYLLVAWRGDIPQERFLEMARRYYDTPTPLLPVPGDRSQSVLRHAATKAMKDIHAMVEVFDTARADPVFSRALEDGKTWADSREYFAHHPDPRVPLLVSSVQKQLPDLFAAIYTVNHYLASATSGESQDAGYTDLETALHSIQKIGAAIPVSAQSDQTLGTAIQGIRNSLPIQFTVPERLQAIIQRIFEQDQAREAAASRTAGETPIPNPQTPVATPTVHVVRDVQRDSTTPIPPRRPKGP